MERKENGTEEAAIVLGLGVGEDFFSTNTLATHEYGSRSRSSSTTGSANTAATPSLPDTPKARAVSRAECGDDGDLDFDPHFHASMTSASRSRGSASKRRKPSSASKPRAPKKTILPDPPALSRRSFRDADGKFPCAQCHEIFESTAAHREHIAQHRWGPHARHVDPETGVVTFRCLVGSCPKILADRKVLRKHLMTHRPPKFECTEPGCGKKFPEKAKLDRHRITHTGEKRYECTLCDKRFGYKSNLNSHMLSHAGPGAEEAKRRVPKRRRRTSRAKREVSDTESDAASAAGAERNRRDLHNPGRASPHSSVEPTSSDSGVLASSAKRKRRRVVSKVPLVDPESIGLASTRSRRNVQPSIKVVENAHEEEQTPSSAFTSATHRALFPGSPPLASYGGANLSFSSEVMNTSLGPTLMFTSALSGTHQTNLSDLSACFDVENNSLNLSADGPLLHNASVDFTQRPMSGFSGGPSPRYAVTRTRGASPIFGFYGAGVSRAEV